MCSFLPLFLGCLFHLLSHLFPMAQPSLLPMFILLLSLNWTLPGASGCSLPHFYNKNLPLSHTMEQSYPPSIHLMPRCKVYTSGAKRSMQPVDRYDDHLFWDNRTPQPLPIISNQQASSPLPFNPPFPTIQ